MLDNFIRGGQIFLHNVAMFKQVVGKTFAAALLASVLITGYMTIRHLQEMDFYAGGTYVKAQIVQWIYNHRIILHKDSYNSLPKIDAYDKKGLYMAKVSTNNVTESQKFKSAYKQIEDLVYQVLITASLITAGFIILVFFIWTRFGKAAKETKMLDGGTILTAREVSNYLKSRRLTSEFVIDGMPLIKDQETRHILITGMTGSGKTNLINKILPQVVSMKQPAIVIDQTGEMISRYYNPARGDIIFNPLDNRSKSWDFWADCTSDINELRINDRLEKFAKVLIGSNRKAIGYASDPFWENSAEIIFCACVEYLLAKDKLSIKALQDMLNFTIKELQPKLKNTKAAKYINNANATTATSILSVMSTSCRPLYYLSEKENKFSIKQHFENISKGSNAWLFLSTPPEQRDIIMPLLSCMLELAVSFLIRIGIDEKRRVWFVADELAALGNLPSLNTLLTESRKYGGCVLAGLQSYNQLLANYGQYLGSAIFGQFATKFIFRCNEPGLVKLMSEMFGTTYYTEQQKNTSYGAHEHRDGISYTEQERKKPLIAANKFMELADLECFVALPDPKVKVAQLQLKPVMNVPIIHKGFEPLPSVKQNTIVAGKANNTDSQVATCTNEDLPEWDITGGLTADESRNLEMSKQKTPSNFKQAKVSREKGSIEKL